MGRRPLRVWDEARLAVSALEMNASGDLLVTRYAGRPDLWSTKPPLLIWMQAALLRARLPPEIAIRLPSAIAGTLTVFLLFGYCARRLRDPFAGIVVALVLLTSGGFIGVHIGRSGDYDAMLVFFVTLYLLAWFEYVEEGPGQKSTIWVFAAGLLGAVLTKGVAGMIGLPALAGYAIARRRVRSTLTDVQFYIAVAAAVCVVAAFYVLRENAAPGYLNAVLDLELGRASRSLAGGGGGPLYYADVVSRSQFVPWLFLIPPAIVISFWPPRAKPDRLATYCVAFAAFFFLVITASRTKLPHYSAPILPALSIVIAVAVSRARRWIAAPAEEQAGSRGRMNAGFRTATCVGLASVFVLPALRTWFVLQRNDQWTLATALPQEFFGPFFRHLQKDRGLRDFQVAIARKYDEPFNAPLIFYAGINNSRGSSIRIVQVDSVDATKPVAACESTVENTLGQRGANVVDKWGPCVLFAPPGFK